MVNGQRKTNTPLIQALEPAFILWLEVILMIYRPTLIALLGLSLTLASCGGGTTVTPPPPETTVTLQGNIANWKAGTGTLVAYASDSSEVARTTTLDAQGKFSINVPKDPTNLKTIAPEFISQSFTQAFNCTITKNSLVISDTLVKILDLSSMKFTKDTTNIALRTTQISFLPPGSDPTIISTSIVGSEYVYADKPTTVKGTIEATCTQIVPSEIPNSLKISLVVDLSYLKGWNNQEIKITSDSTLVTTGTKSELKSNYTGTIKSLAAGTPLNFYTN
jgi:hypothetical protein